MYICFVVLFCGREIREGRGMSFGGEGSGWFGLVGVAYCVGGGVSSTTSSSYPFCVVGRWRVVVVVWGVFY